jgi:uncharacterized phiE125 gp8 family phage protein
MPLSEKPVTPPYAEPIHLDEMKLHLRVDVTADDALITSQIRTAREIAETFTQRQLVAATWKRNLHRFPDRYCQHDDFEDFYSIRLLHPPVMAVTSITYIDTNGATQTLATSVYDLDKNAEPAVVRLKYVQIWPPTREQPNAVTVNYISGYVAPFTATANMPDLVVKGGSFAALDQYRLSNSGGALPTGLSTGFDYLVSSFGGVLLNGSNLRITDEDGLLIAPTSAGTGTHFIGEIPERIRQAMKLIVGDLYAKREDSPDKVSGPIMTAVKRLLWPHRVMEMA